MINFKIIRRKILTVVRDPASVPIRILYKLSPLFGDKVYLKLLFPLRTGYKLDLKNPKTYNEKLQWLKLYYKEPKLSRLVDKYEAKEYVSTLIGNEHVIPNLGIWNAFEDINFETLPDKFVLKTTHDQGGVVICKDKKTFDIEAARKKLNEHLKFRHFYLSREWPYKDVQPRILAEKYMVDQKDDDLNDFKFFCFDGVPKALFIATGRQSGKVKFDYFDMEFNHLDLVQSYEQSNIKRQKPASFDKMVELAKILSAGLPHVRVDFYEINEKVYFGELTFFHHGGVTSFNPVEWDYKFGSWIDLPKKI